MINQTGVLNAVCKDDGGCQVHIFACFVLVEGLVNVGNPTIFMTINDKQIPFPRPTTGREEILPVIAEVIANEDVMVQMGGRIFTELREGWKRHRGQPRGPDAIFGTADDPPCAFVELEPPNANGPVKARGRGAADVCITARNLVKIEGIDPPFRGPDGIFHTADDRFPVNASIGGTFNTQVGGNVVFWQTAPAADGGVGILLGTDADPENILNASAIRAGSRGGMVRIQAAEKVDVNGRVLANGNQNPSSSAGGQGGMIGVQAIDGDVLCTPGGSIEATTAIAPNGVIDVFSCTPTNAAVCSVPAPNVSQPDCGVAKVITSPLDLERCGKPGRPCFCLETATISNDVLTITGKMLDLVKTVEVNATDCDPEDTGTPVAGCTKTATTITCPFTGTFTVGTHVILSNVPDGPSSSCSVPCPDPFACPDP